jgi:hypothetical protein
MGNHMKTTLDISDPLIREAKVLAKRDGTTLRELVERGLKLALDERRARPRFQLRDASVDGKGLSREARKRSWDEIRAMAYHGRGDE